jgi:DASH complex subunit DAD4
MPSIIKSQLHLQEILRANASVKIAADLATKYRKNVQYNLAATTLHSEAP